MKQHSNKGVPVTNAPDATAVSPKSWLQWLERPGIPECLLVVFSLALYLRSLSAGFVYDDHSMIDHLGYLRWKDVVVFFSRDVIQNHLSNFYRPILLLWIELVHSFAGASPLRWHLSQILLHTVCVVLVFRLACHLLRDRKLATFAAAIFAAHPAHVEAVTWVADMADPLMTIFLLLSALALVRWLKGGSLLWCGACWLLATAACFTKEIGVVMPVLLLALVLCVEIRVSRPAVLLTGAALFGSAAAFFALRSQVLHGFAHPLSKAETPTMVFTLPAALWFYLSHLVFPLKLSLFYPLDFVARWQSRDFLLPLLYLAVLAAALAWLYRWLGDRRLFWFAIVWVLVPLLPPLYLKLFPKFELVHDRYLFLPTIGLCVLLAAVVKQLHAARAGRPIFRAVAVVMGLLVAAAAAQTIRYQGVWQNDLALYRNSLRFTPQNDRVMVNLGVIQLQQGNWKEGTALLKRALEIQPNNALALFDLGNVAWLRNDVATAADYFERAVALEAHPRWLVMLGNARYRMGRMQEARQAAAQALAANPREQGAHLLLGGVLLQEGNFAAAMNEFWAELQLYPGEPAAVRALQLAREQYEAQQKGR